MQRELEFKKISEDSNAMVAETVVDNDFNVHVEMVQKGHVIVSLSTVEEGKKSIKDSASVGEDGVFDEDYDLLIAPKFVEVRTTSQVRKAWITVKED